MNNSSLGEQESRVAFHYRPPTELQEGNFFRLVCLLFCLSTGRSPCDHYPWCLEPHCTVTPLPPLDIRPRIPFPSLTLPDPSQPQHQTWDPSHWLRPSVTDIWWPILEPCSNLFTWGPPNPPDYLVAATKACTVSTFEKNWIRIYWLRHKRLNSLKFLQGVYAFIKSQLLNVCCNDYNLYWSTRTLFNFSRDVIKWRKYFYRPQRSCGQGNIFAPVCHSVYRGGGWWYLTRHWGRHPRQTRHPLPLEQTPPLQEPDSGIRSTSGRYASYWNAFLFIYALMHLSTLKPSNPTYLRCWTEIYITNILLEWYLLRKL